jgi:ketosteroid isomerase-like protein
MRLGIWVLLASAPILAACAHASGPGQAAEPELRAAIADMTAAAVDLDADQFMTWYWNSPSLTITFDGETMRGWRPILDQQRKWWSEPADGVTYVETRPAEITLQSDTVATTLQWMTVGDAANAEPAELVITSVWKKLPEGWRIVLAHETLLVE